MRLGLVHVLSRLRCQRPIARRHNIAQRFARVAAFFLFVWDDGISWLEWRRIYWANLVDAGTGRAAIHWQPLQLPSQHHPEDPRPPLLPLLLVVVLVLVLVFPR